MKLKFDDFNFGPLREADIGILNMPIEYALIDPDIESALPPPINYPNTTIYSSTLFNNTITVSIYSPTLFVNTPPPTDIVSAAYRINRSENIGDSSLIDITQNWGNYLKIDSPNVGAYQGVCHILLYFKKSLLQGRELEISWGDTVGISGDTQGWVDVLEGKLLPQDIPDIDWLYNQEPYINTPLSKMTGMGAGPHIQRVSVPDLSSFTDEQVTLVIYFRDGWEGAYNMLLYYLRVYDPGNVLQHDFVLNERYPNPIVSGGQQDYGDLPIGTITAVYEIASWSI